MFIMNLWSYIYYRIIFEDIRGYNLLEFKGRMTVSPTILYAYPVTFEFFNSDGIFNFYTITDDLFAFINFTVMAILLEFLIWTLKKN